MAFHWRCAAANSHHGVKKENATITLSFSWIFFNTQAFLLIDNAVSCVQVLIHLNVLSTFVWWFDSLPPPLSHSNPYFVIMKLFPFPLT